ncbi:hypothetical protein O1611_g9342 [Lasiodiplodia mahajangana]|uniref:Uncharacterized protein n=1 Tax=Lasiodiplodia mahajangana TaxID=1108764 RepID=A0ACC2JAB0_9PEZI|nr:hypothetical protein O1611_g9342 [Lasiodiplodia mahajangana]
MSTNSGSVYSEALQEITNTKLEELSKKRAEFEATKANALSRLENELDPLTRLGLLSQGVKDCFGIKTTKTGEMLSGPSKNPDLELELKHLDSFMAQSKYDPCITPQLMRNWEESLLGRLNMQSSKLEYASLYAQLVTEWLSTEKAGPGARDDVDMAEGYEDVGDAMKREARHGWEKVVFESASVDEKALKSYLLDLFGLQDPNNPAKAKALKQLRDKLTAFENSLAAPKQFNASTLTWVINGLLASDLLTDERREVLKDFLNNPTILTEVADVLDMRLAALSSWSWGESVALEQQRRINGVFNVLMHEDVLQAIFLHYIGTKWSVFLKSAFKQFRKFNGAWKSSARFIPPRDLNRRSYFIGSDYMRRTSSVHGARDNIYRKHYFMANLMSRDDQKQSSVDGEVEANYSTRQETMPQQAPARLLKMAPRQAMPAAPVRRMRSAVSEMYEEADDTDEERQDRNPMEDKQRLIRLLSTEIAINRELHGEVTAFHSVFESWYSLLPHETILTVMALLGTSETWIAFFAKFLGAPLKFLDDDPTTKPRIRRRGTPSSHTLSEVFSESILFCLDFAVNQATGGNNIHRMHDDFWFWSSDQGVAKTAWDAVSEFANATRTYVDFGDGGQAHRGLAKAAH